MGETRPTCRDVTSGRVHVVRDKEGKYYTMTIEELTALAVSGEEFFYVASSTNQNGFSQSVTLRVNSPASGEKEEHVPETTPATEDILVEALRELLLHADLIASFHFAAAAPNPSDWDRYTLAVRNGRAAIELVKREKETP